MDENEFNIEEYKWLRSEISEKTKETRVLERNAVIITGAVWAWLLTTTNPEDALPNIAWFIPHILAWLGALRSGALLWDTLTVVLYIRRIEEQLVSTRAFVGLETWVKDNPWWKKSAAVYVGSTALFWALLLVATWLGARYFGWATLTKCQTPFAAAHSDASSLGEAPVSMALYATEK